MEVVPGVLLVLLPAAAFMISRASSVSSGMHVPSFSAFTSSVGVRMLGKCSVKSQAKTATELQTTHVNSQFSWRAGSMQTVACNSYESSAAPPADDGHAFMTVRHSDRSVHGKIDRGTQTGRSMIPCSLCMLHSL